MDNRGSQDPNRGPRRYGPNARNPQDPAAGAQPPRPARAWSEVDGPDEQDPPAGYAAAPGPRPEAPRPENQRPDPQRPDPQRPDAQRPGTRRPDPQQRDPRYNPAYPPAGTLRSGPPPTAVFPAGQGLPRGGVDPRLPGANTPGANIPGPGANRAPGTNRPAGSRPPGRPVRSSTLPPPRNPRLVAGRVVAAALSIIVLIATGFIWSVNRSTGGESEALEKVGNEGVSTDANGAPVVKGRNILLVGSDSRTDVEGNALTGDELAALGTTQTDGVNTDTIMLIHIPDGGGKATTVSIPRDTWIYSPPANRNPDCVLTGGPYDYSFENKVNSYYGVAKACEEYDQVQAGVTDKAAKELASNEKGREVLIDAVQRLSGLKIDDYAEVNLFGFYLLSEALGGIPVCLVNDVKDPDSGADFKAGPQEVSGSAALAFVRQRHGLPGGDLDRVRRQQAFLAGALDKVISAGTLTSPGKLADLVEAANRSIVLSNGFSLLDLANQMSNLSSGNVNFLTVPTLGGRDIDGKDALDVDPEAVKEFFATLDGPAAQTGSSGGSGTSVAQTTQQLDPMSIIVDVLNGTNTAGMAASVSDKIAAGGFTRGQIGDFQGDVQPSTTIRFAAGEEAAAAQVKKALGFGDVQSDDTVEAGHVMVVVGADAPAPASGLRAGNLYLTAQQIAPTTTGDETNSINAATPGCVN